MKELASIVYAFATAASPVCATLLLSRYSPPTDLGVLGCVFILATVILGLGTSIAVYTTIDKR